MSNATRASIWAVFGVLCCIAAWFVSGSNIVFAICFAGVAVALFAIAASCLFREPPRRAAVEPGQAPPNPDRPRKWHPR